MTNPFKKATKYEAKLRMNLEGVSGSGKTYSSLAIGCALGSRVALLDTEHGSASKYSDIFSFDSLELKPPYHPDRYVAAIKAAEDAGYDVLILDSLSHAWFGTGGLLEIVDAISARTKNKFTAWADATPIQNKLVEAILNSKLHIIATMRSKADYILETKDGKQVPRKVGMAAIQREGMEYEFDVVGEMDLDNTLIIQKSRCPSLNGQVIKLPGKDVATILTEWLSGEVRETPSPASHASPTTREIPVDNSTPLPNGGAPIEQPQDALEGQQPSSKPNGVEKAAEEQRKAISNVAAQLWGMVWQAELKTWLTVQYAVAGTAALTTAQADEALDKLKHLVADQKAAAEEAAQGTMVV